MFDDVSVSSSALMIYFMLIVLITAGIIIYFRIRFKKSSQENLTEKYAETNWKSPLEGRAKYPEVNAFSYSGPLFRYGLVVALALVFFAFSWTTMDDDVFIPEGALELDEEIEIVPPRTAEPPPPPPPPPPPVIEEVPEEEILEEDEPIFEDQTVEEETVIEDAPIAEEAPPPPPPPPPPPEEDEIFKVVEQMPRFPGCENISGSQAEKKKCADQKMLEYIYKNLKYPNIARENGVEGMAVIQFVVEKDGTVGDINLVRDPGAGTGKAALKVIKGMNSMGKKWTPGKQRGRPVKVLYTLPVKFKLEG